MSTNERVKRVNDPFSAWETDMTTKIVRKNLVSMVDHPLYISYGGEGIVLPPKGTIKGINPNKLGALPRGAVLVDRD